MSAFINATVWAQVANISASNALKAQPSLTSKQSKIETYLKSGRTDDFTKLEESSAVDRKKLNFIFKTNDSSSKLKLRIIDGPGTSGGGDILKCGEEKKYFFKPNKYSTYYFADTYELFVSNVLSKESALPEDVWLKAVFDGLNKLTAETNNQEQQGLGDLVQERLERLNFIDSNGPLEDLPDDQISTAGTDCEKKQLAIQDLVSGVVRVDFNLLRKLSYQEINYFKVHEALISLKKTIDDTSAIRADLRNAVQKVSLLNLVGKVMNSYIDIPYTSKMLWVLKTLQPLQDELWIDSNCNRQHIQADKECLIYLLGQKFNLPSGLYAQIAGQRFLGSGFEWSIGKKYLMNTITDYSKDVLNFTIAIGAFMSPRISIVNANQIEFDKYEQIHLEVTKRIREIQKENNWDFKPGLIHHLNQDMERFRKEYSNKSGLQMKTEAYDTYQDEMEMKIGECFKKNRSREMNNIIYTQLGRQFFKCYFEKKPEALIKQNSQEYNEIILREIGFALTKDFDYFVKVFNGFFK
ncbi:MAG: hypothetical protein WA160_01105 [Pseudobdellovibrio sp.]